MELVSLLFTLCALLGAELVRRAFGCERQTAELHAELETALLQLRDARKQADSLKRLAEAQTLTQHVVSGGTATVQAVHMGIARIPFGILEAIPATRIPAKTARQTHDAIAGGVYGAIQGANRLLGEATRKAIQPDATPAPVKDESKDSNQT